MRAAAGDPFGFGRPWKRRSDTEEPSQLTLREGIAGARKHRRTDAVPSPRAHKTTE